MRRASAATIATVVGLGALAAGTAGGAAAASSCASKGVTLAASPHVRVFEAGSREQTYGFWLCRRGARKARWLFDSDESATRNPAQAALAGWSIAYRVGSCAPGASGNDPRPPAACRAGVRILNARTGRARVQRLAVGADGRTGVVTSFVVTARGSAAWIQHSADDFAAYEVWASTPARASVKLATGEIDPLSLATDGRRIYWQEGAVARSGQLR